MNQEVVLAGGCFWGLEELFRNFPGVINTQVGYSGGANDNPTYEFHPDHAEALYIVYNPAITNLNKVLDYFFKIHDPTTINRQGNDIGSSYRSVIFYKGNTQKNAAIKAIARNQKNWQGPIVTKLQELEKFWPAEDYHQDYLQKNPGGYTCHFERAFL